MAVPPNKGMKLTKLVAAPGVRREVPPRAFRRFAAVRTASQLIPGVGRTVARWSVTTLLPVLRIVSIAWAGCAAWLVPSFAGEREALEAPLFAAAIRYAADSYKCTAKQSCCYCVHGAVPSPELTELLRGRQGLTPIPVVGACAQWTLDVVRTSQTDSTEQHVSSNMGGHGAAPLRYCDHVLHLTSRGWVVDRQRDRCSLQ
jgi:hypothetical protein